MRQRWRKDGGSQGGSEEERSVRRNSTWALNGSLTRGWDSKMKLYTHTVTFTHTHMQTSTGVPSFHALLCGQTCKFACAWYTFCHTNTHTFVLHGVLVLTSPSCNCYKYVECKQVHPYFPTHIHTPTHLHTHTLHCIYGEKELICIAHTHAHV